MSVIRRSVMTLYSGALDPRSHQVRIVLAEKGVTVDILNIDRNNPPQDLFEVNPYGTIPSLLDRDLVLYEPNIIMEYLDERFPHPPLLPVYPVARAKSRLTMYRIEQDWYKLVDRISHGQNKDEVTSARKEFRAGLLSLAPVFADMPYFLSEEFSLVDCCIAPLLWRLPHLGIELPSQAKPIRDYGKRMFKRDSFQASLTDAERELSEQHDF
jgi:stringent starvation protein A